MAATSLLRSNHFPARFTKYQGTQPEATFTHSIPFPGKPSSPFQKSPSPFRSSPKLSRRWTCTQCTKVQAVVNVEEMVKDVEGLEENSKDKPEKKEGKKRGEERTIRGEQGRPLIKVCGVTSAEDAALAAGAGADLIGMIMWPGSKRYVTVEQAAQISAAAKQHGAEPVAVFVSETADDIVKACTLADITIAQLHGEESRAALGALPRELKVVYVLHAESDGTIRTPLPEIADTKDLMAENVRTPLPGTPSAEILAPRDSDAVLGLEESRPGLEMGEGNSESTSSQETVSSSVVEWLLVDGVSAGSGETYEWTNLRLPKGLSRRGWLLAGGLDPTNVATAIGAACPDGVDVASGVAGLDKIKKDKTKVEAFIQAVKSVAEMTSKEGVL